MKCKSDLGECCTSSYCEQCAAETTDDWDGKTCRACGKSYPDPSYYGFPTCEDCEA